MKHLVIAHTGSGTMGLTASAIDPCTAPNLRVPTEFLAYHSSLWDSLKVVLGSKALGMSWAFYSVAVMAVVAVMLLRKYQKIGSENDMYTHDLQMIFEAALDSRPYRARISRQLLETLMACDGRTLRAVMEQVAYLEKIPWEVVQDADQATRPNHRVLGQLRRSRYTTFQRMLEKLQAHSRYEATQSEVVSLVQIAEYAKGGDLSGDELSLLGHEAALTLYGALGVSGPDHNPVGEWLVYGTSGSENYYMDLAGAAELKDERALVDRLQGECAEFDFCFAGVLPSH